MAFVRLVNTLLFYANNSILNYNINLKFTILKETYVYQAINMIFKWPGQDKVFVIISLNFIYHY